MKEKRFKRIIQEIYSRAGQGVDLPENFTYHLFHEKQSFFNLILTQTRTYGRLQGIGQLPDGLVHKHVSGREHDA